MALPNDPILELGNVLAKGTPTEVIRFLFNPSIADAICQNSQDLKWGKLRFPRAFFLTGEILWIFCRRRRLVLVLFHAIVVLHKLLSNKRSQADSRRGQRVYPFESSVVSRLSLLLILNRSFAESLRLQASERSYMNRSIVMQLVQNCTYFRCVTPFETEKVLNSVLAAKSEVGDHVLVVLEFEGDGCLCAVDSRLALEEALGRLPPGSFQLSQLVNIRATAEACKDFHSIYG